MARTFASRTFKPHTFNDNTFRGGVRGGHAGSFGAGKKYYQAILIQMMLNEEYESLLEHIEVDVQSDVLKKVDRLADATKEITRRQKLLTATYSMILSEV